MQLGVNVSRPKLIAAVVAGLAVGSMGTLALGQSTVKMQTYGEFIQLEDGGFKVRLCGEKDAKQKPDCIRCDPGSLANVNNVCLPALKKASGG